MTDSLGPGSEPRRIRFSVASISCIACTPAFKKGLERVEGIMGVKQYPMLNEIVVEYDSTMAREAEVKEEILRVAEEAGFRGKVIISRQK
jgi:copper chaperone CopZ